jgi:formamidase
MQALVDGRYRLPWEDAVKVTDGTSCGFPPPARFYSPTASEDAALRKAG